MTARILWQQVVPAFIIVGELLVTVARRRVLVPDERYVRVTIVARDAAS
jgi:hypothetical protein